MKNALLILLISLSGSLFSQTTLAVTNNTDDEVFYAYIYYDGTNRAWNSIGWYKVNAYSTRNIDLGNYNGKIYIHGHTTKLLTTIRWGKGFSACVNDKDAFHFKDVENIRNCEDREEFSELSVSNGINKWYFNP